MPASNSDGIKIQWNATSTNNTLPYLLPYHSLSTCLIPGATHVTTAFKC